MIKTRPRPGSLYRRALKIAKTVSALMIERQTGIPAKWVRKFRAGQIPNPSVNRVELLLEKVGGEKL